MNDSEAPVIPEPVRRMWNCVKKSLAENDNPSPRDIDRLAASISLKLPASTVEGWLKTHSVVPAWEKFEVLIKALAAEQDEDWRALHGAALTADRKRKKEERKRLAGDSAPVPVPIERSLEPESAVPADAVHTTATKGGTTTRRQFGATPLKIGVVVLLVLSAVLFILFWPTGDSGPTPAPSSGEPPAAQPPVRHCAYVITEPAGVYPAPNSSTKQIKFKRLNDRVEILDRPRPPGWVAVSTPQNSPGFNWMQTNVLTASAPCATPLPRPS